MRRRISQVSLVITLLALAGMVGFVIWKTESGRERKKGAVYDAEAPLGMPVEGEVDFRFHFLSPWEAVRVPEAVRFDPPLGSEHAALVYNAQKFWEMNEKRGGHHTGDDLNGIGGMDTDLGDPVHAAGDGLVVYAAEPSPGWGKVVVLAHRTAEGEPVHSMYAHLDRIDVTPGELVERGGRVGTVGTANGNYPAHLHFEMRSTDGVDIGSGYAMFPLNRLDPMETIGKWRNAGEEEGLTVSPLGMAESTRPEEPR